MNSWNGTARSPDSVPAELLYCVIGFISNPASSPQGQSIFDWEPSAGWLTRQLIAGFSVLIWLQASAGLKGTTEIFDQAHGFRP